MYLRDSQVGCSLLGGAGSCHESWIKLYAIAAGRWCCHMKYVLVSGGVVSGLGKGVTASSIGEYSRACAAAHRHGDPD